MYAFLVSSLVLCIFATSSLAHDLRGLGHKSMRINSLVTHSALKLRSDQQVDPDAKYVFARLLLWRPGQTLRACFLNGTAQEKAYIAQQAVELLRLSRANLTFDFGAPKFRVCSSSSKVEDVRVSFQHGCCNSYVGRNSHYPDPAVKSGPSVNLEGILEKETAERRRVVMHELMHVLGFEHEHQAPDSPCGAEFKKEEIIKSTGWSDDEYEDNMKPLNRDSHSYVWSVWDPDSLMQYYFAASELKKGDQSPCFTGNNLVPSQKDIEGLQHAYPSGTPAVSKTRSKSLVSNIALSPGPGEIRDLARALANLDD